MQPDSTSKLKVALVAGTRPEVIKLAPLYHELARSELIAPVFVSTGQHRQMLDQALSAFHLRPEHDLNLMQPGQTLPALTARVIEAMTGLLERLKPAAVLVQGDTTTVLGSALAAFYARIPVGHVEAGLRTYNFAEPWPEEMNRRLVDPISRWCFAPTEWSRDNLLREQISPASVHVTGNTVVDALLWVRERVVAHCDVDDLCRRCSIPGDFKTRYLAAGAARPRWILVTGHRRESFGKGIENLCDALLELSRAHPEVGFLYPVHLNPNVQKPVLERLGGQARIALIPPVGYEDLIWLLNGCHFIISDSGGIQEEAPSLGKPVLVTRDKTERPEGVHAGVCQLVGTDPVVIVREATRLLTDHAEYSRRAAISNPYGDGRASARIRSILETDLSGCRSGA